MKKPPIKQVPGFSNHMAVDAKVGTGYKTGSILTNAFNNIKATHKNTRKLDQAQKESQTTSKRVRKIPNAPLKDSSHRMNNEAKQTSSCEQ